MGQKQPSFDTLSVAALREQLGDPSAHSTAGVMSFQHIVGEAYALHVNPANANAVFQGGLTVELSGDARGGKTNHYD
jgi:hypothetical protein